MPQTNALFPLERLDDIRRQPQDFRLLERIPLVDDSRAWPVPLSAPVGDERVMVLLDTETTGLSAEEDAIIELGMVRARYSPSARRMVSIDAASSQFEDPGRPVPEFITGLTGITQAMVDGQRIDNAEVSRWMAGEPLVVAHNAAFDRPFFERRFASLGHLPWACSAAGIDWQALGFEGRKMEYLLLRLGWFYEGHRATTDCLALAWLFHLRPDALALLLDSAARTTVIVRAFGAPFEVKDALKARGYRWHNGSQGANKHWWCEISETGLADEQAFLDGLYRHGSERAHYSRKTARERFRG